MNIFLIRKEQIPNIVVFIFNLFILSIIIVITNQILINLIIILIMILDNMKDFVNKKYLEIKNEYKLIQIFIIYKNKSNHYFKNIHIYQKNRNKN